MNIKPELKEKYERYVKINSEDEYSKAVIEASEAVCHFHPRGEEMRMWWNKRWGVKDDKGGAVNPAILENKD